MMGPNVIPIVCINEIDFKRLESLIERINDQSPKYPIEFSIAIKSENEGPIYLDIWTDSPAKLQYLSEEWNRLARAAYSFEQQIIAQSQKVLIPPSNRTIYNPVTLEEFKAILDKSQEKEPGVDEVVHIHYDQAPGEPLTLWEKVQIFFRRN